jgi:CBS domain-containing protein
MVSGVVGYLLALNPTFPSPTLTSNPMRDLLRATAVPSTGASPVVDAFAAAIEMDRVRGNDRVLRALLGMRLGNRRATHVAASIGQALAFGIGLLGLLAGAPLLVFVALFVWLGAGAESQAVQMRELSRGMMAADAMVTRFETLHSTARIADAVELLLRTTQTEFPVLDGSGRLRGILTRSDMIRALQDTGPEGAVLDAMRRDVAMVPHRAPLEDALRTMQDTAGPEFVVELVDTFGEEAPQILAMKDLELLRSLPLCWLYTFHRKHPHPDRLRVLFGPHALE